MALRRSRAEKGRDRADRDENPFTQPGFVTSAVVLLLVVICGVAMSIVFARGEDDDRDVPSPDPVAGVNTAAPDAGMYGVGPVPSGSSVPSGKPGSSKPSARPNASTPCPQFAAAAQDNAMTEEPTGIDWVVFRTVLVPSSERFGPRVEHGGVARCYAHSPTGALLAVSQITTRHFLSSDWRSVVDLQIVAGAGRDAFRERQETYEAQFGMPDDPEPGRINQFAGYRFVTYTAETAVIQIVRRTPTGTYVGAIHTVVWADGDWRLQMQSDGSDASVRQPVDSLNDFRVWTGS